MNILMIPSWYPTREMPMLGTFYREQAQAMAARGARVAVIYTDVNGRLRGNGVEAFHDGDVYTVISRRLNLTPRLEKGRVMQRKALLRRAFARLLKEWGKPEVVNLRSSLQGYEALDLCRREGLPLFFMEHSSFVVTEPAGSPARQRLERVMGEAAVTAAVSSALAGVMEQYGPVRVIPDLVDTDRFTPDPAPRQEGPFRFRAMGQLRTIKGYDILIDAAALLASRCKLPFTLEIAGAGVLKGSLQARIDEKKIGDRCRLIGLVPREQTPRYMNGCDCFICSSRYETLSCVLNEAAACGKPVISTDCGGPRDIVTEETGLLVPPEDPAALAGAMERMLTAAASYDPARIRELTVSRFGADSVCDRLLAACEEAMR